MDRLENWPRRLAIFVDARRRKVFAWGAHDCVTFAVDAIREITGQTVFAVTWSSAAEALRAIEAVDGLEAAATAIFGPPIEDGHQLGRGDLAIVEMPDHGDCLAVCIGHALVAPGREGLTFLPVEDARLGWKV